MITSLGLPHFGCVNSKLPGSTLTFALPAGITCPGAHQCLATADRSTGRITDGPQQIWRCHAASMEALRPSVRTAHWRNFDLLKGLCANAVAELLLAGIASARRLKTTHIRWFTSGDVYSRPLLQGILSCAEATPELIHYFYTKNLPLVAPQGKLMPLPDNLRITASWGGRFDQMIRNGGFPRSARILNYPEEASRYALPIDYTDRLAWQDESTHFCHLSHGGQRPGSAAGKAISERRKAGDFSGYSSGRTARRAH